jgi:hypothetical protein
MEPGRKRQLAGPHARKAQGSRVRAACHKQVFFAWFDGVRKTSVGPSAKKLAALTHTIGSAPPNDMAAQRDRDAMHRAVLHELCRCFASGSHLPGSVRAMLAQPQQPWPPLSLEAAAVGAAPMRAAPPGPPPLCAHVRAATHVQTWFRARATRERFRNVLRRTGAWKHVLAQPNEAVVYSSLAIQKYARCAALPRTWFQAWMEAPRRVHLILTTARRLFTVDVATHRVVSEICIAHGQTDVCLFECGGFHIYAPQPNARGETVFAFVDLQQQTGSAWIDLIGRPRRTPSLLGLLAISRANAMHPFSFAPAHTGHAKVLRTSSGRRGQRWFLALVGTHLLFFRPATWPFSLGLLPTRNMDICGLAHVGAAAAREQAEPPPRFHRLLLITPEEPGGMTLAFPTQRERDAWEAAIHAVIHAQMVSNTRRFVANRGFGTETPTHLCESFASCAASQRFRRPNVLRVSQWPVGPSFRVSM